MLISISLAFDFSCVSNSPFPPTRRPLKALAAYGEYPPNSQKYYGVPLQGDVQMLVYRKDIFEAHNKTLPVDIESMLETAEYFAGVLPDGIGFTSFWCGDIDSCYDQTATIYNQFAWMFGGELWDPNTYQIKGILDSKENVDALDYTRRLYEAGIGAGSSGEKDFGGALDDFCSGKSPMLQIWAAFSGTFNSNTSCSGGGQFNVYDDVGFYPIPYSSTTNKHQLSLGGMGMHVRKTSENSDLAIDLIKHIAAHDQQVTWAELGGFTVRKSVTAHSNFLSDANKQLIPYNAVFLQSFPLTKDFWNLDIWGPMLDAHQKYLMFALNNTMTSAQALTMMATEQQQYMDARYPCGPYCLEEWDTVSTLRYSLSSLGGFGIASTLGIAGIVFSTRDTAVIRASSVPFLFIILGGLALGFSYVILLHEAKPSNSECSAREWISNIAFALSFGSLFSKTQRISRIFNIKVLRSKKSGVSTSATFATLAGVVTIFVLMLSVWTITEAPSAVVRVEGTGRSARQYIECDSGMWRYISGGLKLVFLLWGSYLAYTVRNVPSSFNEAKYIGICIHNWIIIGFFSFVTEESVASPVAKYVVQSMGVFLTLPVVLGVLFVPKIIAALSNEQDTDMNTQVNATKMNATAYSTKIASESSVSQEKKTSQSRFD